MKTIAQGAEATISEDEGLIIKQRIRKHYRHPAIDASLRKRRTKREAKVLETLALAGIRVPKLEKMDDKDMEIAMELIKGPKLRDALLKNNFKEICFMMGQDIASIHKAGIIHGDLTTSNMILESGRICFIDFGLSFFSKKIEDRAVDLHLLRQALESRHHTLWEKAFSQVKAGYSSVADDSDAVFNRLLTVEGRGRYKGKRQSN